MAGKANLTKDLLRKALEMHCVGTGKTISEGDQDGKPRFLITPGDIIVREEDGKLMCEEEATILALAEIIGDLQRQGFAKCSEIEQRASQGKNIPATRRNGQGGQMVRPDMPVRDIQVAELTLQDITEYLCPKATPQEAFMFLKLCQARGLNPFLKEAYLIKYSDSNPATMVVGKEHFTKTAEMNAQFDGFEAGIILKNASGTTERREGTFLTEDETLIGGYAKVWRKDRSKPFVSEVALKDFYRPTQSKKSPWDTMPAVMIRKVPLVQSLREAFPTDLAGCYDRSEMEQAIDVDYSVQGGR